MLKKIASVVLAVLLPASLLFGTVTLNQVLGTQQVKDAILTTINGNTTTLSNVLNGSTSGVILNAPTIADHTNATHTHASAAQGGSALTSPTITTPTLSGAITGDIYSVAWTDYSSSATIVGWSSYGTKAIYYKKIGKTVFMHVYVNGTSNSINTTISLPFAATSAANYSTVQAVCITNNTVVSATPGTVTVATSGTLAYFYKDWAYASSWTASGTKEVMGSFWYEAAS
jgi:hypothetical protein